MNTREEQIAEMTSEVKNFKDRTRFLFGWDGRHEDEIFATLLYDAGYRKQSDTVREILQKLIYNITANNTNDGYLSESIDYSSTIDDIKELAAQYGVEVEE